MMGWLFFGEPALAGFLFLGAQGGGEYPLLAVLLQQRQPRHLSTTKKRRAKKRHPQVPFSLTRRANQLCSVSAA